MVVCEFYGLTGFPSGLAGDRALVGRVRTPAAARRPKPASRSTVAALLSEATSKIDKQIESRPGPQRSIGPEKNPVTYDWVLRPPAIGRALSATELRAICLTAYEAAFDLVCRSEMSAPLHAALHRWAEVHAAKPSTPEPAGVKVRVEHRNACHAVLTLCLWEITHGAEQLAEALRGDPLVAWFGMDRTPTGGRIADHSRWGVMTAELSADEFVLLVDDVLEQRDNDGRAAELVLDLLHSGGHQQLLTPHDEETVLWSFGYGLAAAGSWHTIEFARWYTKSAPRSLTTASLLAWAAHVASLHRHDALAWRLCGAAERVAASLGNLEEGRRTALDWQVHLIRSGCRIREADRWVEQEYWVNATRSISESVKLLRGAVQASQHFANSTSWSRRISNDLRRAEILVVACRMRNAEHPAPGFEQETDRFSILLTQLRQAVDGAAADDLDSGDHAIFKERIGLLESYRDFLDDSPPDLPTT